MFFKEFRALEFTYFIFAVPAFQNIVGTFPEAFRMLDKCKLPAYHHHQTGEEQTPCEEMSDKKHRGEHHKVAPVKNSAVYATFILDEKTLERTPQHHTDQVADIVKCGQ